MSARTRLRLVLAALAACAAATLTLVDSSPAQADSQQGLPVDTAAHGYIGLCNEAGQNVTGGSIDTRPFIWKAVSSSRPPSAYQGQGENAVVEVFQPRPGTAPAYWSGMAMTAAAFYTTKKAPAVQATYADIPLRVVIKDFPPEVNGLYVLRMNYGKADYGLYSTTYPVTVIQVTGTTWHVVQGGTVDCSAAKATSSAQLTGVASKQQSTPHAPSSADETVDAHTSHAIKVSASGPAGGHGSSGTTAPGSGSSGSASAGVASTGKSGAAGSNGAAGVGDSSPQAADRAGSGGTSWVLWLLVGVVVLLAAALATVFWTRRPSPGGADV